MKRNDQVPWEEHCTWFGKILEDQDRILCIGLQNNKQKIGVARFDRQLNEIYEVSINLNPVFRGQGLGRKILKESIAYLKKNRKVIKLFAGYKKINVPSRKTFEYAGFTNMSPKQRYPGMEEFDIETECYCELDLD